MNAKRLSGTCLFPRPGLAAIRAGAFAAVGSVLLLFSLAACKSAGRESSPGTQPPGWLYVSLKITRPAGRGFAFSVVSQVRAGAMPARREGDQGKIDAETLVCAFYDRKEKWSHTRYVPNPLYREVEFFGEDGTVGRKKLSLAEATFTVGTPRAGDVTHLVIRSRDNQELARFTFGRP